MSPLLVKTPYLGFGLGLRPEYYEEILTNLPLLDWFEITSENYFVDGGKPLYYLDKIRAHYPLVMHGVSLSLGSNEPLNNDYLHQLKTLANRIEPAWISDHLCWTGVDGLNMHDLLPMPYTHEAIEHIVSRINQVQDYLGQRIALENVSSYLNFSTSEMTEWDFLSAVANKADCYILLDVNNVYVSSINHGFKALDYIQSLPSERIIQIHLAGHSDYGDYIIDTHDASITSAVWSLYADTIKQHGLISTMIERDDNMPPFSSLLNEINMAKQWAYHVLPEEALA